MIQRMKAQLHRQEDLGAVHWVQSTRYRGSCCKAVEVEFISTHWRLKMQKSCDPRTTEPLLQRTSTTSRRSSLARFSVTEQVEPLDDNIVYRVYKPPPNPTFMDHLLHIPRNMRFYFRNLSAAFGSRFVSLVVIVYGLQQGLGNAWFFQARDYYFKDTLGLDPAEAQAYTAAAHTPWNIKPLYGIVSDTISVMGLHRTPYIALAGSAGVTGLVLLAVVPIVVILAVVLLFSVNFSVSSPDVMIDAVIAEKCKYYPKFASDLQSLCWGSMALFSVIGFGTSGIMIQFAGPRLTFGILVFTSAAVLIGGMLGWLGEKPDPITDPSKKRKVICFDFAQYNAHRRLFRLAIFVSMCAVTISVVVLATTDWTVRFVVVLFIACTVAFSVYYVNKEKLPDVANVALFIFLQQSLTPDIETTIFYWYTDADNGPNFDPIYVGVINMIGYSTMFLGIAIYNKYLTSFPYRTIFTMTQLLMIGVGMLDLVIVTRTNKRVGIPDEAMIFGDTTLSPMVKRFIMMPIFVLAAKCCPDGAEATLFAMLMALSNFGQTVAIYFGSFLVVMFGVTDENFDNLFWVIIVKSLCRLLPIPIIYLLVPLGCPDDENDDNATDASGDHRSLSRNSFQRSQGRGSSAFAAKEKRSDTLNCLLLPESENNRKSDLGLQDDI